MSIKKTILKLEKIMKEKYPEFNAGFYVSRRNNCVHMGLDNSIFPYLNYANIIEQINLFFDEHLAEKLNANYPQLIHTAKWNLIIWLQGRKNELKIRQSFCPKICS